jgi:hypothetical protein
MNDPEYEQWKKERLERRNKIPKITITLPLDMAEFIADEFKDKSKWVGITGCDVEPYECYDEFIKQVKLQKKKIIPA